MLYFPWSKWIFNITFRIFFFAECSATWQLDCRLPCNRSAGQSPRWQVLELIFGGLLTTHVCVSETSGCLHACVSETSGSDHAWVSETHVSCTFPCTKRPKKTFSECCRFWKVLPISNEAYATRFLVIQTRKTLHALKDGSNFRKPLPFMVRAQNVLRHCKNDNKTFLFCFHAPQLD